VVDRVNPDREGNNQFRIHDQGEIAMTDSSPADVQALHEQRDWLLVTLSSIGDAVITTDTKGQVTFMNPVAESLTGWPLSEAGGQPLDRVLRIINEESRKSVESPSVRAFRDGRTVQLAEHSLLISRDGTERGYAEEVVLYQWHNHVRPAELLYLEPYRESCDIVVDNTHSFESGMAHLLERINELRAPRHV